MSASLDILSSDCNDDDLMNDDDSMMDDSDMRDDGSEMDALAAMISEGMDKDPHMLLTNDERERALAIKQAIESSSHIKPVPDLEYAHLAITVNGNMARILDVAYRLQCFREQYKLNDTPEEGNALIREFVLELFPGLLLDISYIPSEQCYSASADLAALFPKRAKTEHHWRVNQGSWYYLMRAMANDIQSIRNGIIILSECQGMGFHNFDPFFQERSIVELWAYYPAVHRESVWLHTPSAANLMYSMCKRLLKKELWESWKMGGTLEGYEGRLDTVFNMPSPDIARRAMLTRIEGYLEKRYHHERTFSLT